MDDRRRFELASGLTIELCEDPIADDGESVRVRVSDTYGVLAPLTPLEPPASTASDEVLRDAARYEPPTQGSVHWLPPGRTEPARIRAVVYDFDRDPTTTPAVVRHTLEAVLEKARARGVETLVLPYDFGLAHGGISDDTWIELLAAVLKEVGGGAGGRCDLTVRLEIPAQVGPPAVADRLSALLRTLH